MKIKRLRVRNYRVLRDVEFKDLTPFTVLCGANGSGKSTFFDVFAFLNESFAGGLRQAWDQRNRLDAIRSRGADGPIEFEIAYYAPDVDGKDRLVTYTLAVDESHGLPVVVRENLRWSTSLGSGRPRNILNFELGTGTVYDEDRQEPRQQDLAGPDLLAVSALGQFREHPRVRVLRDFINGWYLSYVSAAGTRTTPNAGPETRLSKTGDNLANVVQHLQEEHPARLQKIFDVLSARVPQLESVLPSQMADGRLLLQLKDRPFDAPVLSKFTSDGTLKLLAYLTIIYDPSSFQVIGIEEPENQLHPKLLPILADELREVSQRSQIFVTTHSPEFMSEIRPRELWMVERGSDGYAIARRASDDPLIVSMIDAGASLGSLWSEGYLRAADPQVK